MIQWINEIAGVSIPENAYQEAVYQGRLDLAQWL
jgi:hypothetical protein